MTSPSHLARFPRLATLAVLVFLAAGASLAADTSPTAKNIVSIVNTPGPGGFLGTNGFDVYIDQAVAARFTVPTDGDMRLARVGLWLMNNSDVLQKKLRVMVQTDALDEGGTETLPSGTVVEQWTARVNTFGWDPVEQFFVTASGPLLKAGRSYWVVAASQAPAFVDPVWTFARRGTMVTTTTFNGAWQTAGNGGALTLQVDARPVAAQ